MAIAEQLTLIEDRPKTVRDLEKELKETQDELKNVRRGLFKRYGDLIAELGLVKTELKNLQEKLD